MGYGMYHLHGVLKMDFVLEDLKIKYILIQVSRHACKGINWIMFFENCEWEIKINPSRVKTKQRFKTASK